MRLDSIIFVDMSAKVLSVNMMLTRLNHLRYVFYVCMLIRLNSKQTDKK